MLESIAKALVRCWRLVRPDGVQALETPVPLPQEPRPGRTRSERRSRPAPSPLDMRRGTSRKAMQRADLRVHGRHGAAAITPVPNGRKPVATAPKRTPERRHVWLEPRMPVAPPHTATLATLPARCRSRILLAAAA